MTVYLDNSATTRPSEPVRKKVLQAMESGWFNPSALYKPAMEIQKEMEGVRERLLEATGAGGQTVLFTSGGTEADNLALLGFAKGKRNPGRVLISSVEHPAVSACREPLEALGFRVAEIPAGASGTVDLEKLERMMDGQVDLIAVMQVNNESGAVEPLERIAQMRSRLCPQARLHVDGVQGFLRVPVCFNRLGLDSYALSAHKIHGLKGTGALILRKGSRIRPLLYGGGQEGNLRSGTENTFGILALGEAVRTWDGAAADRMARLRTRLAERLRALIPETVFNSPAEGCAPHILNAAFPPVRSQTMLLALEGEGVYVSAGSACASRKQKISPVLRAMGVRQEIADCSLRFSLCPDNTEAEIDYAAEKTAALYGTLKKYTRR